MEGHGAVLLKLGKLDTECSLILKLLLTNKQNNIQENIRRTLPQDRCRCQAKI